MRAYVLTRVLQIVGSNEQRLNILGRYSRNICKGLESANRLSFIKCSTKGHGRINMHFKGLGY